MSLEKIEIPIPRLRPGKGGIILFSLLLAVSALSVGVMYTQFWQLLWMNRHSTSMYHGFKIYFGDGSTRGATWLPAHLYRGPHHQFAIAAGIMNLVVSVLVMALFLACVRLKKDIRQHFVLTLLFIPALTLTTASVLCSFILHGVTERLNTYLLFRTTPLYQDDSGSLSDYYNGSPRFGQYHNDDLDFESWTCGVAYNVPNSRDQREPFVEACTYATWGRWLQLPLWFVLVAAVAVAWVSFRGVPGWRAQEDKVVDREDVPSTGGEGRIRLA
ncbi:hypothetical protein UCREL1_6487 [Eutypa lata UCREL1]|uniref:Uncharacterized protein n=1 Tax=Eutypa lata (strain UCR-EL1) TaxID=1287681 RepID=M7SQN8_EUTLA|nr:hypothetical protein UCREL1_6487 [Eutypa lata UCREL1]